MARDVSYQEDAKRVLFHKSRGKPSRKGQSYHIIYTTSIPFIHPSIHFPSHLFSKGQTHHHTPTHTLTHFHPPQPNHPHCNRINPPTPHPKTPPAPNFHETITPSPSKISSPRVTQEKLRRTKQRRTCLPPLAEKRRRIFFYFFFCKIRGFGGDICDHRRPGGGARGGTARNGSTLQEMGRVTFGKREMDGDEKREK